MKISGLDKNMSFKYSVLDIVKNNVKQFSIEKYTVLKIVIWYLKMYIYQLVFKVYVKNIRFFYEKNQNAYLYNINGLTWC